MGQAGPGILAAAITTHKRQAPRWPHSAMRKPRLREMKSLAQGHTVGCWRNWHLNPGLHLGLAWTQSLPQLPSFLPQKCPDTAQRPLAGPTQAALWPAVSTPDLRYCARAVPPVLESRAPGKLGRRGGDWAGKPVRQLSSQHPPLTSWACAAGWWPGWHSSSVAGQGAGASRLRPPSGTGDPRLRGSGQGPHAWPPTLTEPQLSPSNSSALGFTCPAPQTASLPPLCFWRLTF